MCQGCEIDPRLQCTVLRTIVQYREAIQKNMQPIHSETRATPKKVCHFSLSFQDGASERLLAGVVGSHVCGLSRREALRMGRHAAQCAPALQSRWVEAAQLDGHDLGHAAARAAAASSHASSAFGR